ncbi:MAG: hypothetical protein LBS59_01565 [Puniceicoccales bacterium]|nr:hypothetical protein [Puniceicoccales bacterium]
MSERLDWRFGNPNTTGVFIALLMVSVWVLPAVVPERKRGVWRWAREVLWFGALGLNLYWFERLLQTGSRGGAVAALVGLCAVAILSVRWKKTVSDGTNESVGEESENEEKKAAAKETKLRVKGVLKSFWGSAPAWRWAALGLAVTTGAVLLKETHPAERLAPAYSIGDASIGNRLKILKWGADMVADAPGGWGVGMAPKIFAKWYQDPDHLEKYSALVNSHLEHLVEWGWWRRLGYLFGWILVFRLIWPERERDGRRVFSAAPFGVWAAWFVGAATTTMTAEWQLWVAPAAVFLLVLLSRLYLRKWPGWRDLGLSVALPTAVVIAAIFALAARSPLTAHEQGDWVKIGGGKPGVVVLVGEGARETERELRTRWRQWAEEGKKPPTMLWVKRAELAAETSGTETLVLVGKPEAEVARKLALRARRIVVFSPQFSPEWLFDATILKNVEAYAGELASMPHEEEWEATGRMKKILGEGDLVSNWVGIAAERGDEKTTEEKKE